MIFAYVLGIAAVIWLAVWADAKAYRIEQRHALLRDRYADTEAGETR